MLIPDVIFDGFHSKCKGSIQAIPGLLIVELQIGNLHKHLLAGLAGGHAGSVLPAFAAKIVTQNRFPRITSAENKRNN